MSLPTASFPTPHQTPSQPRAIPLTSLIHALNSRASCRLLISVTSPVMTFLPSNRGSPTCSIFLKTSSHACRPTKSNVRMLGSCKVYWIAYIHCVLAWSYSCLDLGLFPRQDGRCPLVLPQTHGVRQRKRPTWMQGGLSAFRGIICEAFDCKG